MKLHFAQRMPQGYFPEGGVMYSTLYNDCHSNESYYTHLSNLKERKHTLEIFNKTKDYNYRPFWVPLEYIKL